MTFLFLPKRVGRSRQLNYFPLFISILYWSLLELGWTKSIHKKHGINGPLLKSKPYSNWTWDSSEDGNDTGVILLHEAALLYSPWKSDWNSSSTSMSSSQWHQCNGKNNLKQDLGMMSVLTAMTSSAIGVYSLVVNSMTSNSIEILSGVFDIIIWLPSTFITYFNLSDDQSFLAKLGNVTQGLSVLNSVYGTTGLFFGTADVIVSSIGEGIALISITLSAMVLFPTFFDYVMELMSTVMSRRTVQEFVNGYGCTGRGLFDDGGEQVVEIIQRILEKEGA